jgi:peptidoglycan hydrolase-like protein with peptidoglycan-binding domain
MESLAYLHLALANEAPIDADYNAATETWESLKQFGRGAMNHLWWTQKKLSTAATVSLLSLSLALGILGMATQVSAAVQQGDRGTEVSAVQQRLQELGYLKTNATGYFGSLTKEALMRFQQDKGLVADGVVTTDTLVALGRQPKSSPRRVKQPSPKPVQQSSGRILQLGARGSQVSALQESLAAAGFPSGGNGIFDEATQKAVMRFQQTRGLVVDGIVGPQTQAELPAVGGPNPSSTTRTTTRRSRARITTNRSTANTATRRSTANIATSRSTDRTTPRRSTTSTNASRSTDRTTASRLTTSTTASRSNVEALQRRLQELGFYRGEIDGIWGPQTQAAVEAAQRVYSVSTADLENERF